TAGRGRALPGCLRRLLDAGAEPGHRADRHAPGPPDRPRRAPGRRRGHVLRLGRRDAAVHLRAARPAGGRARPMKQFDLEATARRPAAASALAASRLARADARRQLIVGAGRVGGLLAPAMRSVRAIDDVAVWSRDGAAAKRLAASLAAAGHPARAVADLASA